MPDSPWPGHDYLSEKEFSDIVMRHLNQGAPTSSLFSLWHMVELRSRRRVETEEILSASGARVDTSRGRTLERLEALAPPAPLPPRIREFRNPAKVLVM
ncbi:hypothetical protein Taro_018062 [Colocasia esculenta]|uniref:Uncharacterized protein n=1 Tax=Colocasia esculenta TaxID=4460 RepID=A0A843USY9_COLES|nr:hypothetical protein [Colocasia esculenta]